MTNSSLNLRIGSSLADSLNSLAMAGQIFGAQRSGLRSRDEMLLIMYSEVSEVRERRKCQKRTPCRRHRTQGVGSISIGMRLTRRALACGRWQQWDRRSWMWGKDYGSSARMHGLGLVKHTATQV